MGSTEPEGSSALPALPNVAELAERRAANLASEASHLGRLDTVAPGLYERHGHAAARLRTENRSNRSRLGLALQLVDEFGQAVQPLVACRRGCDHCCHIRVEMTELEAERLGAAIGRTPNRRLRYMPADAVAYGYETPCPFLDSGECSIYEHRPFACRKHHSLDVDPLLCRLDVPDEFASAVPRIQPQAALFAWGSAITASMGLGDIRDFFPGPRELARGPVGTIPSAQAFAEAALAVTA